MRINAVEPVNLTEGSAVDFGEVIVRVERDRRGTRVRVQAAPGWIVDADRSASCYVDEDGVEWAEVIIAPKVSYTDDDQHIDRL